MNFRIPQLSKDKLSGTNPAFISQFGLLDKKPANIGYPYRILDPLPSAQLWFAFAAKELKAGFEQEKQKKKGFSEYFTKK